MINTIPRIVIAGLGGDTGKTLLTLGLIANLKDKFKIAIFKKGPDYIDPAWLTLAGNSYARNLDTFIMSNNKVLESFVKYSENCNFAIIEGNRGLFDGYDEKGTHSTAELAKLIKSPIILLINSSKVTRTAAAIAYGCKFFDKKIDIKGIVLNNVSGLRHTNIIKNTILNTTGIPVVGAIPKIPNKVLLPSRHLGLVTPHEMKSARDSIIEVKKIIQDYVDIDRIIEIAQSSHTLLYTYKKSNSPKEKKVKIGIFKDKAFSFYYPENLEALNNEGAELISISSIKDTNLDNIDGLYIGGGFPETNINDLAKNLEMLKNIKLKAEEGLPIYAECGGLIYLAKDIEINDKLYKLSGVLPISMKMNKKPEGHGYTISKVDIINKYFKMNSIIKAHEFHYSSIVSHNEELSTCLKVLRGEGTLEKREGIIYKNVFGTYLHIHSLGVPQWAKNFVKIALIFKNRK